MTTRFHRTARAVQIACGCLLALAACVSGAAQDSAPASDEEVLRQANAAAQELAQHLGMVRYEEHLAQRKLKRDGKVDYQEDAFFDSLTLVSMKNGHLVTDQSSQPSRPSADFETRPLLRTSGFATMALVLHPYYKDSFHFTPMEDEVVAGMHLKRLQFDHVPGADSPTALRLRGRNYPLDLSGELWLDPETLAVVRVVADLAAPMDDIGLRSLHCDVRYDRINLNGTADSYWLPVSAIVELQTPTQHWRNVHTYSKYHKYSVDVVVGTGDTK